MNRRFFLTSMAGLEAAGWARQSAELRTVHVSAAPYPTMAGFYMAQESGYFQSAGFNLDVQRISGAPQAIPVLAGGQLDAAFTALSPAFFNAVARGARIRIVAGREIVTPGYNDCALYGYRPSFPRGLADLKELKGKRIAVAKKAAVAEYWLDAMLEHAGLTQNDVTVVVLDHAEAVAALATGKIDALTSAFFLEKGFAALEPKLVLGIRLSDVLPGSQFSHILFGQKLLDGPVEVGARFLKAYLRGSWRFGHGGNPKFLDDLAQANGWDLARTREACRQTVAPDARIDKPSLDRFAEWAIRKGYCPPEVKAVELVDMRFLDAARQLE